MEPEVFKMTANSTDVAKPRVAGVGDLNGKVPSQSTHASAQERGYLIVLALITVLFASIYPLLAKSPYKGSTDLHATIEMVGALFGLVAGFALIVRFYTLNNRFHLFVGLAFFVNGAEDLAHGLLSFRYLQQWTGLPASSLERFIPGTYVAGRLLLGILLLLAPFATRWTGESLNPKRETKWTSLTVLLITIVVTVTAFQLPLPRFIYPDRLISRPVDFLSAIVLLVTGLVFLLKYHRGRDMLTWWLLLSIAVNVVGQFMMSFSKALYDPFFDIAHVYKVFGYVIPILGFSLYQIAIITERRRAEEKLKEYSERLEEMVEERTRELKNAQEELVRREKLAVLGQLAGGIGHELRNPLAVMSNACYFLDMKLKDVEDEVVKDNIRIIDREIDRANKIITDLLDFARTRPSVRREADINQLVTETLSRAVIPENVTVNTDFAGDMAPVSVDPTQIGQVFLNLIDNAVQAMKGGGTLKISTRIRDGSSEVIFADEGCGIPRSDLEKIFEPLFTSKAKGIGLGLAVSKNLVRANGGDILVEGKEGKGSVFTVKLEMKNEE